MNYLKRILWILVITLLLNSNANAKKYSTDDVVENQFYINKKFILDLPKGKWTVVEKKRLSYYGLSNLEYTLVKTNGNKVTEAISIIEWKTAGFMENLVNHALIEIMFKDKYDGCYDRPEYTVMEFYKKGSSHNCFWVGHHDLIKHIYNPDNPELKIANTQLKMWLKEKKITLPETIPIGYTDLIVFITFIGGIQLIFSEYLPYQILIIKLFCNYSLFKVMTRVK